MTLSTIFLLGAGASHEAGIQGIESMTSSFLEQLSSLAQYYYYELIREAELISGDSIETDFNASYVEEIVHIINKDILENKQRFDIELLLEALNHLDNTDHILYSILTYPEKYLKYDKQYRHIKNILLRYIRNLCENISSVNYLHPLSAFEPSNSPLDIFTLNYDGTIEKMCEENDLPYTDGFKEDWNPDNYTDETLKIRLYKLHGSLYWYKTEKGRYIKLPIKNVRVENLTYFMDEKISETLIWPMITKDYSSGPFPWLMEEFRKRLRQYDLCIVLGYSFRDDYIKQIVLDELQNNGALWLLIVDHNAEEIKDRLCKGDFKLQSRVMIMDDDIEKSLSYRILKNKHVRLGYARDQENMTMSGVISVKTMSVYNWGLVFDIYRELQHHDRIKYLFKYLLANFESEEVETPSLQWIVFDLSLLFSIEYYLAKNREETNYWLKIFDECSNVFDWVFRRDIDDAEIKFPIMALPKWAKDADPSSIASNIHNFDSLFTAIGRSMKLVGADDILEILNDFFTSLRYYRPIQGDDGTRRVQLLEMQKKGLLWRDVCYRLREKIKRNLES